MLGDQVLAALPYLTAHNHAITSPSTKRYNCIAWAAGCDTRWWWPSGKAFWPPGVPRQETLDAFVAAFVSLGYQICADGSWQDGYEKIALYVRPDGRAGNVPTHAAKQLDNGRWTSKLGGFEDIEHLDVGDVNGLATVSLFCL